MDHLLPELQASSDTRIVQAPKLVALDDQEATIFVGTEVVRYVDVPEPHRSAAEAQDPVNGDVTAGIGLTITPHVTDDGFVRMTLLPEVSMLTAAKQDVGTLNGSTPVIAQVPIIQRTEVHTEILANDGNLVVLGGLRDDMTQQVTPGLPFLGNTPILRGLFSRQHRQLDVDDVVFVIVTPTILRGP